MVFKKGHFWVVVFVASLCLCGCDVSRDDTSAEVELYKCNTAQLDLVKEEVEICKETGYLDSYCFRQAKKTQCEKISTNAVACEDL